MFNLGAEEVLDYHEARPDDLSRFDATIDTIGSDLDAFRQRLTPDGRFVTITADLTNPVKRVLGVVGSAREGTIGKAVLYLR